MVYPSLLLTGPAAIMVYGDDLDDADYGSGLSDALKVVQLCCGLLTVCGLVTSGG